MWFLIYDFAPKPNTFVILLFFTAGSVGWAEHVGPMSPRNIRKPCQTSLYSFQSPATSFQWAGSSPWAPWAPETFKNPVKPLYFVSKASHIIPASSISGMGRACGHLGPQKLSKNLSDLFFICFRGQPHHSSQQDRLDRLSPWVLRAPETFENLTDFCFVSEACHIIPASRIS